MVITKICSGFSPAGYVEYGKTFLDTFARFWPGDVQLEVYTEEPCKLPKESASMISLEPLWRCHGIREFLSRHADRPVAHGRAPLSSWKASDRRAGYSFRFDAVKFSRQCVIPLQASLDLADGDILVWMDADVVTFKAPPADFIGDLLRGDDGIYLGRGRKHSEIGFWAVRLRPRTRLFLETLANAYVSDGVFTLGEWHSAYVWDRCREKAQEAGSIFRSLTPNKTDHVWHQCALGLYTDHLKGKRKALGRSPERQH